MESDSDVDDPSLPRHLRAGTPSRKLKLRNELLPKEMRSHHVQQQFRDESCYKPEYKNWLSSVLGKPLRAKCVVCNTDFLAELTVVKNHAKGVKLIKNLKSVPKVGIN